MRDALKRGVLLDASLGRANFDLNAYTIAFNRGIIPHIISSDLVQFGLQDIVFNMGAILSRFMGNGLSLSEIIARATLHPAKAVCLAPGTGELYAGGPADITVTSMEEGEFIFTDKMNGTEFTSTHFFRPRISFVDGIPYKVHHHGLSGTSPWTGSILPEEYPFC